MTGAGELRERVAFEAQSSQDTSYGIAAGEWEDQFHRAAAVKMLVGSEPVIAQRLQGVQPAVFTVRWDPLVAEVDASWRLRDLRTGALWNIRAVTPDERRVFVDFLCDTGIAQ